MACRRAGDWCRGWPRAIGAGAVGHGTRGGVAAGVRKSQADGWPAAAEMAEGGRHVPAWNNENKIFLADTIK